MSQSGIARDAERVRSVPASDVTLDGRLGRRHANNVEYLLWRYLDVDQLLFPFEHRDRWLRRYDFDGEYIGKWLDAAVLTVDATGDPRLREACDVVARRLRNAQEPDGYLGTELPEHRTRPSWPHWMHWLAIKSLREHGQRFGDDASLQAAARGGEWVLDTFSPLRDASSTFFVGDSVHSSWPGYPESKMGILSILDEIAELHGVTGDRRYLDFGMSAIEHFPLAEAMRTQRTAVPIHAYSLLTYLGGAALVADAAGETGTLDWIRAVWDDLAAHHLFPTASMSTGELLDVPPADIPGGHLQETCATVEWMLFTSRLSGITGDVKYAHMIDRIVHNALPAAQSGDGLKWMYYTPLRSGKSWFDRPVQCCYFSGPRGIARLPELVYARIADGLRVDLFEPGSVRLDVDGHSVVVRQETGYPAEPTLRLSVDAGSAVRLPIQVRMPERHARRSVLLNGEPFEAAVTDGYLSIDREWTPDDRLEVVLDPEVRVDRLSDGSGVVMRGIEALALDRRDNAVDLETAELAGVPELAAADAAADGRARYRSSLAIGSSPHEVVFTPYADAGDVEVGLMATDAGFRTAFPSGGADPV